MKYIIFQDPTGMEYPVIFGEHMQHRDAIIQSTSFIATPVAAGFVSLDGCGNSYDSREEIGCSVWLHSVTLNLKSRGKTDQLIIDQALIFNA